MPTNWAEPEEIINAELEPAEDLLWAGRPRQGLIIRGGEFIPLVILLFIFGPSLMGMFRGAMINNAMPVNLLLLGLPHLLFTGAYVFGRPIYDSWSRARCAYGVTSERVIIISGLFGRSVRSLELDSMVDARLVTPLRGGGGAICFGHNAGSSDAAHMRQRARFMKVAMDYFELDRDAQSVYRLIHEALGQVRRRRKPAGVVLSKPSPDLPAVWEQANELVEPELAQGEILLWSGRPRQGFRLNWSPIVFTLLAFLWMQSFMMIGGGGGNFGTYLLWFLLAIKAISVATHVGRSIYDARQRSRTAYAVTTNRLLTVTGGTPGQVKTLALSEVAILLLTERGEMAGTLLVGPDLPTNEAHQRAALTSGAPPGMLRFDLTQDARLLYRLIRRARRPVEAVG